MAVLTKKAAGTYGDKWRVIEVRTLWPNISQSANRKQRIVHTATSPPNNKTQHCPCVLCSQHTEVLRLTYWKSANFRVENSNLDPAPLLRTIAIERGVVDRPKIRRSDLFATAWATPCHDTTTTNCTGIPASVSTRNAIVW